jgi:hypothetical protein
LGLSDDEAAAPVSPATGGPPLSLSPDDVPQLRVCLVRALLSPAGERTVLLENPLVKVSATAEFRAHAVRTSAPLLAG